MAKDKPKKKKEPTGVREFDEVVSSGQITKVTGTSDCGDLKFTGHDYTSVEYAQLIRWMKSNTTVEMVLRPVNPPLTALESSAKK